MRLGWLKNAFGLLDENHPDPARADFARRWNEAAKAQAPVNKDVTIKATAPKQTAEEVFQAESQARANAMWESDWAAYQAGKTAETSPILIHGSPVKGLHRVEPFVPEIRKGAQATAAIDTSALVYGLDPDYGLSVGNTVDDMTKTLLGYATPKAANGTVVHGASATGSIYIGRLNPESSWIEAEKRPPNLKVSHSKPGRPVLKTPEVPVRVSSEGFDVLEEISVEGKTQEQISEEINKALERVRNPINSTLPTGSAAVADANATLASSAKKPLIQPDMADIKPDQMYPGTNRPRKITIYEHMSVDELINERAKSYRELLNPDYANDNKATHRTHRSSINNIDNELSKRGENISMLPDAPAYDPNYVPGSGKRAPYLRSKEPVTLPPTPENMGAPSATKVQGTVAEAKAEEVVAKVTTSSESTSVKMGEAAAEKVTEPAAVKATAAAGVKSAREAAAKVTAKATTKATDAVGIGIGKVKNFGAKEGAIGAGVAAAAAILAFRNT